MSSIDAWWKITKCQPFDAMQKAMSDGQPLPFSYEAPHDTIEGDLIAIHGILQKVGAKDTYIIIGRLVTWQSTEPITKCVIICNVVTGQGHINVNPDESKWLSAVIETDTGFEVDPTMEFGVATDVKPVEPDDEH